MITWHEVRDEAKVAALVERMDRDGWQGAPLVRVDEQLITGTHRYAAYTQLFGGSYGLPTIELEDVFAEAGMDLAAVMEAEGCEDADDPAMVAVVDHLPESVKAVYGIDIH